MSSKISPMTNYYIRKLYRQKDPYVSHVEDMEDDFSTFLDLEQALKSLYGKGNELDLMVRQLETLVRYHQGLTSQSFPQGTEIAAVEQRIFAILGESQEGGSQPISVAVTSQVSANSTIANKTVTVNQLLQILNHLQNVGSTYLGAAVTYNYLKSSRPTPTWFEQFQIVRSQPITFSGNPSQSLEPDQLEQSRQWVQAYIQSCAQVITKFPNIVNQAEILTKL
ncbi:MAG: hypothetical protein HC851_04495 [Acaryochloris sp. RU_4_1]|nr:hypothetical protein [Acaryochloris sp. SU_5_25]NJM64964.1 hypothetical protein [Acaryochloris sp. RU_4_1]NJR54451.1 hypothetical protein [Acaryochloris sp. CRU_2_0]